MSVLKSYFRKPGKSFFLLLVIGLLPLWQSCSRSNNGVYLLCEKYNSQAPFKIDNNTTLAKVVCTDAFFTFNYILTGFDFNDGFNTILESSMIDRLKKAVNNSPELDVLKKAQMTLGYVYEDDQGTLLFTIMFSLVNNSYIYDKQLSMIIFEKLSNANISAINRNDKGNDQYNWYNKEHGIFLNIPANLVIIENDESKMLINAVDTIHSRTFELIYSDDASFKILTQEAYSQRMTKEALSKGLTILYDNVSYNIWEPNYHTKNGDVFHTIYTGTLIEYNIRQTVIVFQMIRKNKLYTIKGSCLPPDTREFYMAMREALDSLFFL